MLVKRSIIVTFEHVGMHCWPKAPEEVYYLRNDHRHLFKFKVELPVDGPDRELEFHLVQNACISWAEGFYGLQGVTAKRRHTRSCEDMAEELLHFLRTNFEIPHGRVEVWEDGENAGVAEIDWEVSE